MCSYILQNKNKLRRVALFLSLGKSLSCLTQQKLVSPTCFCICSAAISHVKLPLKNSSEHSWENESEKTDNVWAVLWKWCRSHGPPERSSRVPWGFHHRTSRPSAPIVLSAAAAVHSLTHIPLFEPTRNCSTPTFPVLNCLPEFAQTHVHWVGDAV